MDDENITEFAMDVSALAEPCSSEIIETISKPYEEDCITKALHRRRVCWKSFQERAVRGKWYKAHYYEDKLRVAASLNDVERVLALMDFATVNPDAKDSVGRTALHIAASRGYSGVVEALLRKGANPNVEDVRGNTALHLSVYSSSIETTQLLLKAGCVVRKTNRLPCTPLDMAESKLRLLEKANKDYNEIKQQVMSIIKLLKETMLRQTEETALVAEFSTKLTMSQDSDKLTYGLKELLTGFKTMQMKVPISF